MVEYYRVDQLPGKASFSKDLEDEVGLPCKSAPAKQVARRFQLAASTVRAIDLRYLERWEKSRSRPVVHQLGVDEIHPGKWLKFLKVAGDVASVEPLWFGAERKEATLDEFFAKDLGAMQLGRIQATFVNMWESFTRSILRWVPD